MRRVGSIFCTLFFVFLRDRCYFLYGIGKVCWFGRLLRGLGVVRGIVFLSWFKK